MNRQDYIEKGIFIEKLLRENGATGKGLKELAESISEKLDSQAKRALKHAGWLRNMAAHDYEFSVSEQNKKKFLDAIPLIEKSLLAYKEQEILAAEKKSKEDQAIEEFKEQWKKTGFFGKVGLVGLAVGAIAVAALIAKG